MELIQFIFKSFWHFIGFIILLGGCMNFIYLMFDSFWKAFKS